VQWDAKKRRYVQLHGGDADAAAMRGGKRLRTESGALVTGKLSEAGTGLYKKWQAKTKRSVALPGSLGGDEDAPAAAGAGSAPRGRGRHAQRRAIPNAGAREELKSVDQIRKERKVKERKAAWASGRGAGEGRAR